MAPFDPLQLLKALSPLLSNDGGIKSAEEVPRLSSLMKKFSKKLVSRCVYCNVLKATTPDVLNSFLDLEGWMTINSWIQDAKDNNNDAFLLELLVLCQGLPMTVLRLKQNNTAKLVKTFTKAENSKIRRASIKVVEAWMKLIKGATASANEEKTSTTNNADKLKKKKVKKEGEESIPTHKDGKSLPKPPKSPPRAAAAQPPTTPPPHPIEEDVEYEPDPPPDERFKHKEPRPKTVKTLQTRFRSTGLIEENPLPKVVTKKPVLPTIDRDVVAAATKKRLSTATLPSYPVEKKIKPSSLITPATESNGPGIKLIPPKPRPVHILHESAGFMDALVAVPAQPLRKKKTRKVPSSPTTPPPTTGNAQQPPKLQFYKDTLDMGEAESKTEPMEEDKPSVESSEAPELKPEIEPETKEEPVEPAKEKEDSPPPGPVLRRSARGKKKQEDEQKRLEEEAKKKKLQEEDDEATEEEEEYKEVEKVEQDEDSEATQEGDEQPMEIDDKASIATTGETAEIQEVEEEVEEPAEAEDEPGKLKSILTLTRRRDKKKKSVQWVEDDQMKQFFYFEMDENERVNVNNVQNFGDLKSIEMKRERMAFEHNRRRQTDNMTEGTAWRPLKLIAIPAPLVDPGANSKEKILQRHRQETTLEEIYFTRESLPDTPHEPDPDLAGPLPQEPILIPVEDISNPGILLDYSTMDLPPPKAALPPVLTSLMMSITTPFGNPSEEMIPMGVMNDMPLGPPGPMNFHGELPPVMVPEQFPPQMMMMPPPPIQQQQLHQPPVIDQMGPNNMEMWGMGGQDMGPNMMDFPPNNAIMKGDMFVPNHGNNNNNNMMGGNRSTMMGGFNNNQHQPFQQRQPMHGGGHYNNMRAGGNSGGNRPPRQHSQHRGGMNRGGKWHHPSKPVCHHFVSGTCMYGRNCNYLHPGVNGPA